LWRVAADSSRGLEGWVDMVAAGGPAQVSSFVCAASERSVKRR
jgi:hypothetical protein